MLGSCWVWEELGERKLIIHACFVETARFFWNDPESVPVRVVLILYQMVCPLTQPHLALIWLQSVHMALYAVVLDFHVVCGDVLET